MSIGLWCNNTLLITKTSGGGCKYAGTFMPYGVKSTQEALPPESWGRSIIGNAARSQREDYEFESRRLHQFYT
jgi:hypothetical protein